MGIKDLANRAAIAYGNTLVKGYNWLTGRDRVDLANDLVKVAPVLEGSGYINAGNPLAGLMVTAMMIGSSIATTRRNERQRSGEESLPSDVKSVELEITKQFRLYTGGIYLAASGGWALPPSNEGIFYDRQISDRVLAAGHLMRASSEFVMLADADPPKRKNVVRRGISKLAKLLEGGEGALSPLPGLTQ